MEPRCPFVSDCARRKPTVLLTPRISLQRLSAVPDSHQKDPDKVRRVDQCFPRNHERNACDDSPEEPNQKARVGYRLGSQYIAIRLMGRTNYTNNVLVILLLPSCSRRTSDRAPPSISIPRPFYSNSIPTFRDHPASQCLRILSRVYGRTA